MPKSNRILSFSVVQSVNIFSCLGQKSLESSTVRNEQLVCQKFLALGSIF